MPTFFRILIKIGLNILLVVLSPRCHRGHFHWVTRYFSCMLYWFVRSGRNLSMSSWTTINRKKWCGVAHSGKTWSSIAAPAGPSTSPMQGHMATMLLPFYIANMNYNCSQYAKLHPLETNWNGIPEHSISKELSKKRNYGQTARLAKLQQEHPVNLLNRL